MKIDGVRVKTHSELSSSTRLGMDEPCNKEHLKGYGLNTGGVLAKSLLMILLVLMALRYRFESTLVSYHNEWSDVFYFYS